MNVVESVRISWRAITGHKLRSTLTTIGVVIGVASVIAFMVLGGAFEESILGDVAAENEPVVLVQTQGEQGGGLGQPSTAPIYTQSDVEAVRNIAGVELVAVGGSVDASQLTHGGEDTVAFSTQVASPEALERGIAGNFSAGGPFQSEDEVVVNQLIERVLGHEVAVGDELSLRLENGSRSFTVAGVVNGTGAPQQQPTVYLPVEPYYDVTIETPDGDEERSYPSLTVYAESVESVDDVQSAVQEYFNSTESDAAQLVPPNQEIQVQTLGQLLDLVQEILDQITNLVAGIAGISLVVGSIGIANIMIVSVTERTREIGIMKAVGARQRDVIQLFLVESVILGAIGAVGGIALGLGAGFALVQWLGFPMAYPWYWVAVAVAVGVVVGVLSGLYPAWRAARVDPIEALRRE